MLQTKIKPIVDKFNWKKLISFLLLAFSIIWLGLKIYSSWEDLSTFKLEIRYEFIFYSFLLYLIQWCFIIFAWKSIMNSLDTPLKFFQHAKIYGYTNIMRRIPAGFLFLLAARANAYKDQDISIKTSAVGSFLEIFFVLLTGLTIIPIAAFYLGYISIIIALILSVFLLFLELYIIQPSVLLKLLTIAHYHPIQEKTKYNTTLSWFLIYVLIWILGGIGLFLIINMFVDYPISGLPITVCTWILSSLISYITIISPSGLGVKEISLTLLLGVFLSDPLPVLVALGIRVIWTIYDVILGLIALII